MSNKTQQPDGHPEDSPEQASQPRRLAVLAQVPESLLETAWHELTDKPVITRLRGPETGLLMVRGRAGGCGQQFNLGEVPVTRATVCLADTTPGYGFVLGQRARHAELIARFDALVAEGSRAAEIKHAVVVPAAHYRDRADAAMRERAEATRVDFSTLVRGR